MENYFFILFLFTSAFIIFSGVFSLFDFALDLCRISRLEKEKSKKCTAVLKILENPHVILLSCRIWSNLLKAAAVISFYVIFYLSFTPAGGDREKPLVLFIFFLVICVFILSLIITLLGDFLPRLLARTRPEKIAVFLLPVMKFFSIPMIPFTKPAQKASSFLDSKMRPEIDNNSITEEELQDELRNTLLEGEKSGIVETKERAMVEGVFYLGDKPIGVFMTHRSEIQWLDINLSYEEIREKAVEHRQQECFPVVNASPDEILGAVYLVDIILDYAQPKPLGLRAIMKKAQFVPQTMSALKAFESFKQGQSNYLFVMDEYGGLAGIISIRALVEEIVGELSLSAAEDKPLIRQEDGTWLADGTLNIDDAAVELGLGAPAEEGGFHTLAGLILHIAGEIPKVGDSFEHQGYRFKVVDKDGNRIDKLLISKIE